MKDRVKTLRKTLGLTQREFADRIGMKPNTVATYEMGRSIPSDPAINNICKEFRVSEMWLRTGSGEMFLPAPRDALDELIEQHGLPREFRSLTDKFLELRPEQREAVIEYMRSVAAAFMAEAAAEQADQRAVWEAEADEFAAMAREQFLSEKIPGYQASFVNGFDDPGGGKSA